MILGRQSQALNARKNNEWILQDRGGKLGGSDRGIGFSSATMLTRGSCLLRSHPDSCFEASPDDDRSQSSKFVSRFPSAPYEHSVET